MKAKKQQRVASINKRRRMNPIVGMPMRNIVNPLRVDTKLASAGVDKMKMGAGIFVKVKF